VRYNSNIEKGERVYPPAALQVLESAFTKGEAQTGGEEHVVALQAEGRISDVAVAEGDLPPEPGLQFGGGGRIEVHTIVTKGIEVWKEY
jgi:hypothetical protein